MTPGQPDAPVAADGSAHEAGRPVDALCQLLSVGDEADRCYAAHALGVVRRREAVPALVERLTDPDVDVCVNAADALARIRDPAAVPPLLTALRDDPDGEVKTAMIDALARIGGEAAVPALMDVARNRPAGMVLDDSDEWDAWWDMQLAAIRGLGALGITQASSLLEQLLDDEEGQDIEAEILAALVRLSGAGESVLTRRLASGAPRARRRAARALARADSPHSADALGRALLDGEPEVRAAAIDALAERGARRYLPPILTLYKDTNPQVRESAVRASLRLAGTTEGAAPEQDGLRPLLRDRDPRVRALAIRSLDVGALDDVLLRTVRGALTDTESVVVAAACWVLARTDEPSTLADLTTLATATGRDAEVRRAALRALGTRGEWTPPIAAALAGSLAAADSPVRLCALTALADLHRARTAEAAAAGRTSPPTPIDLLLRALRDAPSAGETAPAASGSVQEPDAGSPAGTGIPVEVRERGDAIRPARSSLEAINIDNAEVALALADQEANPQTAGIELDEADQEYVALTEANEAVARWLFARDGVETALDLRRLAARVLAALDGDRVVSALVEALADDDEILALEAAGSLAAVIARAKDPALFANAFEPLVAHLGTEDRDLRIACIRALALLGRPEALPAIAPGLEDPVPAVRMQTAHALGVLVSRTAAGELDALARTAIGRLTTLLEDDDPGVRVAAASALVDLPADEGGGMTSTIVEALIDAAFRGAGDQARDMGRALRGIAPGPATVRLLEVLSRLPTSAQRRFAIEMLEEIHGANTTHSAPASASSQDPLSSTLEVNP